ncbi:lysoplasmalogenase family protein [Arsenophonus nasoniae]|uniref:Lysoplasmalogenase family protein n=1 Tax=Arsenophonus nasoniae TaxID=638 RepID=D2U2J6_9GAMM|nr:lysoplasmalogenase family protein [Arsenophonus nasoniae]QBY45369.1 YhhN family protein [Arsenophonus nasoniae]WGL95703.1 lysoplasmalogenase family protein [Arsenophonus nasoniae]WGM01349.1 lysoplasmalogenase family protein [Arsenophonus nasoniae]WGM05526.1 lysoplasmalogenase family protein [Arsenophonus nasoniae]WGM10538.1 lysoplasmalogenase family protein [Arsenophonus nasoniae]
MISWPFLAVLFSGWLYIDAAYRGPQWQCWLFRPVTLLLLVFWAWSADITDASGYLIMAGLFVMLMADGWQMLSSERLLPAIFLLSLSFLLYTISFALQMNFSFYLPLLAILLILSVIVLIIIWTPVGSLRAPVFFLLAMSFIMAWIAGEQYFGLAREHNFSIMIGAFLLFLANSIWLIANFRYPFKASKATITACYFIGQFLIVRSLYL